MVTSFKINDGLYLIRTAVASTNVVVNKPSNVNHVFVVDCSGSMAGDLPRMQDQIINKLPAMLTPGDTFSLIWFSGRGEYGTVLEVETVETLKDVKHISDVVRKWLRPVGLTGFVQPLELVAELIKDPEPTGKFNSNPWSMTFLSDGCDNQWPQRNLILDALEKATNKLASVTIVEYGYYADRPFLAKMAERAGGQHVFAQDFRGYEPVLKSVLEKKDITNKRVEVTTAGDPIGGFAWTAEYGEIVTHEIKALPDHTGVEVPEGISTVFHLSSTPAPGSLIPATESFMGTDTMFARGAYSALALFSLRGKPEIIFPLLKATGDVFFIDYFTNCFGKQRYSEFFQLATEATFDGMKRLIHGYNPNRVPAEDAFTIIDLLKLLAADEKNRVLLDHADFKYSRIGRARVANEDALKFEPKMLGGVAGYSVNNLVFNEDQPNISINVRKEGTVNLGPDATADVAAMLDKANVPLDFETNVYRNYAIVKDGLVNVEKLPVLLHPDVAATLHACGVVPLRTESQAQIDGVAVEQYTLDLKNLPVINRNMVKNLSAEAFFQSHYRKMVAKAAQKVFGHFYKERVSKKTGMTRTSESMEAKYGTAAAAWLRERGLNDHGFSPRTASAKVRDFYMGKELKVSLKGLSDLPSVPEAIEALKKATDKKPARIGARLMKPFIEQVEQFIEANKGREQIINAWLDGQQVLYRTAVRKALAEAAQSMICVVVGQTWFKEFATLDEKQLVIDTPDGKLQCTVDMREITIQI